MPEQAISVIKDWWHVFAGCALAIWYASIRVKRRVMLNLTDPYVRESEMDDCKDTMMIRMDTMEERAGERHEEVLQTIIKKL